MGRSLRIMTSTKIIANSNVVASHLNRFSSPGAVRLPSRVSERGVCGDGNPSYQNLPTPSGTSDANLATLAASLYAARVKQSGERRSGALGDGHPSELSGWGTSLRLPQPPGGS